MAAKPKKDFSISGPNHLHGTSIDWNNKHHRRIIMSSLVNSVYTLKNDLMEKREGENALAPPWWKQFHFEKTKNLYDPKKNTIFGAIFKFNSPNHADTNYSTIRPPKYVIAFRGTSWKADSIIEDMKNNFKIIISRLHKCRRLGVAKKVVEDTIEQNGGGVDTIWLAGHSLGAAIALTVGRDIVLARGFHLPTYLFNPPCAYITTGVTRSILIAGVATMMGCSKDDEEFKKLSNWVPNIFVNPKDRICKGYMGYFKNRETMKNFGLENIEKLATQHSLASFLTGEKRSHLLPVAHLTINKGESQKPHALKQWWVKEEDFMGEPRTVDKFWEIDQEKLGEDGNGERSNVPRFTSPSILRGRSLGSRISPA